MGKTTTSNKKNQQPQDERKKPLLSPPLECSPEEYDELTKQVVDLSASEAAEELLECARYGETDAVRAILVKFPEIVDTVDDGGSTALHKACANGHLSTATLLIRNRATLVTNKSGNTPLHWAAASGHDEIVALILEESSFHVDVLQKNEFGRSILTEGFSSQSTQVVKLLLEHDSATEEKLLAGGTEVDVKEDKLIAGSDTRTHTGNKKATIVHDFSLCDTDAKEDFKPLRIRELPIENPDSPFGESAIDDTTGYGIWSASLVMARWMASLEMRKRLDGMHVLELGAGCGVPGLAAAHYSNASRVYVTDLNPTTIDNLHYNIDLNSECGRKRVSASAIDWDDERTWPKEKMDFVIGSDLIYQESIVPLLKKVVVGLLKPATGRFLYVAPDSGRDGLPLFIESMKCNGCDLVCQMVAPESYCANPLSSGDEEDCFLHFHELASTTYMLYEFRPG